jgi:hypothetical protein
VSSTVTTVPVRDYRDPGGDLQPVGWSKIPATTERYKVTFSNDQRAAHFEVTRLTGMAGMGFSVDPADNCDLIFTKAQLAPVACWLAKQLFNNR